MSISQFLIFLFASLLTFSVSYYHLPTTTAEQIIIFLLIVLLIFSNRLLASDLGNTKIAKVFKSLMILLSVLFVQLLVISTGGFKSPFLFVLYLFGLAASFFLNIGSSTTFLIFSLILLSGDTYFDKNKLLLFQQDPGTTIIYSIAFIAIIPVSLFLERTYQFKETVLGILSRHIKLEEKKAESILASLEELVLVTDINLNILSANEAVSRALDLTLSEIVGQPLFKVLPLKDDRGNKVDLERLPIGQAVANKATFIAHNYFFKGKNNTLSGEITIQIRPLVDLEGVVNEIVFVIADAQEGNLNRFTSLDEARMKHKAMIEDLKKLLIQTRLPRVQAEIELISKTTEDLMIALEIKEGKINYAITLQDIAQLCKKSVSAKLALAQSLGVDLKFVLPEEEVGEIALLDLAKTGFPEKALPLSKFAALIDARWFDVLLSKLLDMAILITCSHKNGSVRVMVTAENKEVVGINIETTFPTLDENQQKDLFLKQYGNLGVTTNLRLGSGLEGFIVENLISQLKINFTLNSYGKYLIFQLTLPTRPAETVV